MLLRAILVLGNAIEEEKEYEPFLLRMSDSLGKTFYCILTKEVFGANPKFIEPFKSNNQVK